jgi:putative protease
MAKKAGNAGKSFYLSLPHICRREVYNQLKMEIFEILREKWFQGFLLKNFEEAELLQSLLSGIKHNKDIVLNYNMYIYNKEAKSFWKENGIKRFTAPVELNFQELKQLGIEDCDMLVYGYLPLMVSAQCLYENIPGCQKSKQGNTGNLIDRLGKKFFVQTNCTGCYNVIYNGQALSLHKQEDEIARLNPENIRLDFTMESAGEMDQVLRLFIDRYVNKRKTADILTEYTTGHFKRGVE